MDADHGNVYLHHNDGSGGHVTMWAVFEGDISERGRTFVLDLVGEMILQRKLIKELVRQIGLKLTDTNEYHRRLASWGRKIGVNPDDLHDIADPLIRELSNEMLVKKPSGKVGA